MKFEDSQEFLAELDKQLRSRSERGGRIQDFTSLKAELAIERFLARIDPEVAIVKGGSAVMFNLDKTPHTKDVDLIIAEKVVRSLGLTRLNPDRRADALAELIQDFLRSGPKEDFFRFKLEDAFAITDLKPGHACARINFTVMIGKVEFHFMQADIALQDGDVPTKLVKARNLLKFASVDNPHIRTVTPEYLVADKVTLYLEEHGKPDAGRVKDIVHAALIISSCKLHNKQLARLFADRARHRQVLDKLAEEIPDPPQDWSDRFEELIEQTDSTMTLDDAMMTIKDEVAQIRSQALRLAQHHYD